MAGPSMSIPWPRVRREGLRSRTVTEKPARARK
jgi:hypothetical protein